ncbi:MAG TPA: translation initiation factor IF-2, partial [Bacteroidales bacterium]
MSETTKVVRLSKAAKEFNIGIDKIISFIEGKGLSVENNPNAKLTPVMYDLLTAEFHEDKHVREIAQQRGLEYVGKETISIETTISKPDTSANDDFVPDELIIKNLNASFSKEKTYSKPKTEAPKETKVVEEEKTEVKEQQKVEEPAAPVDEISDAATTESAQPEETEKVDTPEVKKGVTIVGNIDLDSLNQKTRPKKKTKVERQKEADDKKKEITDKKKAAAASKEKKDKKQDEVIEKKTEKEAPAAAEEVKIKEEKKDNFIKTKYEKLAGPTVLDKIVLPEKPKKKSPVASSSDSAADAKKRKRKRIRSKVANETVEKDRRKPTSGGGRKHEPKHEPSEEEIQKQIKDTLARLAPSGKSKAAKHRRTKRDSISQNLQEEMQRAEDQKNILKVTEFLTANELATMMDVSVTEIIKTCMQIGMFVSINQRIGAETISLVAEEFGYQVEFVSADDAKELTIEEQEDDPHSLVERAPIVTVMGHVDHGKTKLLDYIRKANVVAGEAGGITQHIGAYEVTTESGKKITFLDTPGHEAFTAMRARGAKVTDIAIIVIAADDSVMPQTKEAINHAQAAGVPIVFAFNKMDKPGANADKIREQLSTMNILVEEWGGKFQTQEISAITGAGIDDLLVKVLLEAEMLEVKANPDKPGKGTVIEASLDKGRGYVATMLVQEGTMKKGDVIIAGPVFGKIKAMFNERNHPIDSAGPSTPVVLLGLTSAPQAGDIFNIMADEREAKHLAS